MTTSEKEVQSKITSQQEIGDYLVAAGFRVSDSNKIAQVYECGESLPLTRVSVYTDGWIMVRITDDIEGNVISKDLDEGRSLWDLRVSLKAVDEVL